MSDLRALIEAMVQPLAEALAPGSYYARFQAQVWADGAHTTLLAFELQGMDAIRRLSTWIDECLCDLPDALRSHRLMLMGRFMLVAMVSAPISPAAAREMQALAHPS